MPDWKQELRERLANLKLEPAHEAEIVEELSQHLQQRYEELLATSISMAEARRTVLDELSSRDLLSRELRRAMRQVHTPVTPGSAGPNPFAAMWRDVRYSMRSLRLSPTFSIIAILSLALGIGANTAIFQLLDAVRIRTLPVEKPDELVSIGTPNLKDRTGAARGGSPIFSNPLWEAFRDHQQAFSGVMAWSATGFNLATGGQVHIAQGLFVSGSFFNVLGVPAIAGRVLAPADDEHGCGSPGAVISYAFWQREYGGQSSAVGSILRISGHPVEIIGVTPPSFFGTDVGRLYDVAVPLCAEPLIRGESSVFARRDGWWLAAMGRLKPGSTIDQANAQLESISPGIFQSTLPSSYNTEEAKAYLAAKLGARPASAGLSGLRKNYEDPLWLLLALAGTALVIACANLANLMFARATARQREFAVRLALGASRARLIQQLLVESLLLALCGAATGILLAQMLTRVLVSFLSTQFSKVFLDLNLDWRVLGFTMGLAVLTCLLFGLMPAIRSTGASPAAAMKAGSRGSTSTRERFGLRRLLVVSQVALSLVLLVGALLFVRTFQNLLSLDAGFQSSGILIADTDLTHLNLPLENRIGFKKDLLAHLRSVAGVESAAEVSIVPVSGNYWNDTVHTDASGREVRAIVNFNSISPGFFKTLGTPILQGRDVSEGDTVNSPAIAVVNEAFVRSLLAGRDEDAIGKTFRVETDPGKPEAMYQIVGIVRDTKYLNLREAVTPIAYLSMAQAKDPDMGPVFMVRSSLAPDALAPSLDRVFRQSNPAIGFQFSVYQTQIRDTLLRERLMATLSGFFGFLAVLLATIGLYGVMSYMVARRTNEIGVRMALGANRSNVLGMVLREAGILLVAGLVIGAVLTFFTGSFAQTMLYGLQPHDPLTLAFGIAALAAVAFLASYLPARRAAKLDPMVALREE